MLIFPEVKKMLQIKFNNTGTSAGVADGLANYVYYYAAMHAYVPSVTITDDPLADYWANHKTVKSRFNIDFYGGVYEFDEEKSAVFKAIVSSGPIEIKPFELATVTVPFQPTAANLGRMAIWGQIISPTGSYVEKIRKGAKSRVETLAKTAFNIPEGSSIVSGLLPHAFVECARRYNFPVIYSVEKIEKEEDWTW